MEKYAVIGNPINHSLSPSMHNAAFRSEERDANYEAIQVSVEAFDAEIAHLLAGDFNGFNVTVPFKERIIPHLDELSPFAKRCGAVNTVIKADGKWLGDNTDGAGFMEGLHEIKVVTSEDRILIIGAGGASKAIYLALADASPQQLVIVNRTVEKAAAMVQKTHEAWSLAKAEKYLADFTIIIQTTSIGLPASKNETPIQLTNLQAGTVVVDIIYNPAETAFLKQAKTKGAVIQNGLPMFIGQGALAYQRWTGHMPNLEVMKKKLLEELGGQSSL